jgi:hypothetical protein
MVTTGDGVHINDGPGWPGQLKIEVERIDVSSSGPKVDERWSFVDAAGHFHAYYEARTPWPTLRKRIEAIPCDCEDHDEDCNGASITHWHCLICDEEIEPGMIPGPHHVSMPGLTSWEVRVQVPAEAVNALLDQQVSLRMEQGTHEAWGVAQVSYEFSYTSGDPSVSLTMIGVSPLGRRKAVAARV